MLDSDSEASMLKVGRLKLRDELDGLKHKVCELAQQLQNSEGELQTICHRLQLSSNCTQHMMAFVTEAVRNPSFRRQLRQQQTSSESLGMPKRQRIAGLMATSVGGGNRTMDVDCASAAFDVPNADQQSRMAMPLSPLRLALQDEACHHLTAQADQGSPLPTAESHTNESSGGYGASAALSAFAAPQFGKTTMRAGKPAEFLPHSKDAVLQYKWDVEGAGAALPLLEDGHNIFGGECASFEDSSSW